MPKSTSTKPATTDTPPPEDPLAAYLSIAREGNPDGTVEQSFWIGSLALTNATVPIYAKSEAEVQARAKELLAAHGVEV
jgi:hypothetical protein